MPFQAFRRALLPILLLIAGALFLSQTAALTPESTLGRKARLNALAPAGAGSTAQSLENAAPENVTAVSPIIIHLDDVVPADHGPGQYEQWLAGEIDMEESFSFMTEAEVQAAREAALALDADDDIWHIAAGHSPLGIGFDSLDYSSHPNRTFVPPDPDLTAGSSHLIAVVNSLLAIYAKDGTNLIGPLSLADFFASVGEPACIARGIGAFDPVVLYDESTDRYIIGADGDGTHFCVAVSVTGDATGAWFQYAFPTNVGGHFFDYPHIGVGRDAIYLGANMFDNSSFFFVESRVWALDKVAMYAGVPANSVSHSIGGFSTPQPAKLHGFAQGTWPATGPHYILAKANNDIFVLYAWDDPFGLNNLSNIASFNLTTATGVNPGFPVPVPQQGTSDQITGNDIRLLDTEYRDGHIWTTMTIACNPGGGTVNCIRWAEINPAGPSLVQAGVFSSPGDYRIFPDLAVDRFGNMAVGYTKSNSSMFPSVWAACRAAGDAPGTMGPEMQYKAGETAYISFDPSPYRWGDYTGMTIDPDGETFWYLGEYAKNIGGPANWGTYVSGFTAADCLPALPTEFLYTPLITQP